MEFINLLFKIIILVMKKVRIFNYLCIYKNLVSYKSLYFFFKSSVIPALNIEGKHDISVSKTSS